MPTSLRAFPEIDLTDLGVDRRDRPTSIGAWSIAAILHGALLWVLLKAPILTPAAQSGAFGHAVSVTLVAAGPGQPQASSSANTETTLSALADRLTGAAQPSKPASRKGGDGASLSDLMGPAAAGIPGPATPRGALTSTDDPFSRAFVSYRGDDPAKAASLEGKARSCAKASSDPLRVLVILNAEGRLLGRPKPVGAAGRDPASVEKIVSAIERCAPYTNAATPGAPRSYEVQI